MTVAELIERLHRFDPNAEVRLTWSHGGEPGPVTDVHLRDYWPGDTVIEIEGEQ